MKATTLSMHNFRSFENEVISLDDFFILAGANNTGKSNAIDAIRVFYENGLKYTHDRDFPKFATEDDDSWIEIGFALDENEWAGLKGEYQRSDRILVVRKILESEERKPGLYAVREDGSLHETLFYGAKNIQQAKLGKVIYIPAVSKLVELTKMTGPSPLRDIVNLILGKVLEQSKSYNALQASLADFENNVRTETNNDGLSLNSLESRISDEIASWGIQFRFRINSLSVSDVVKNLIGHTLREQRLDNADLPSDVYGHGFQRYLIFTLIKLSTELKSAYSPSRPAKKKEFSPSFTWLLFEEPEAFLHPSQIAVLSSTLRDFASESTHQVLISTHNPIFLSRNIQDLTAFARLTREGAKSRIKQVSASDLKRIFSKNQDEVQNWNLPVSQEDLDVEMESIKYALWLDERRASGFFANKILLVEGPTEVALFNYLIQEKYLPAGDFYVFDSLGKYNIHRFMNLFGELGINHAVLYDSDNGRHAAIDATIEKSKNASTIGIDSFATDIEGYLGIPKVKHPHRKPQHVMYHVRTEKVSAEKLSDLSKRVKKILHLKI